MKIILTFASEYLNKDFLSYMYFPTFSITTTGSIGRMGASAEVAASIDRMSDAAEEVSICRKFGAVPA